MLNSDKIIKYMRRHKHDAPHSGLFAQVQPRRCGTKVSKASANDYAYVGYLDFIEKHPESTAAPKIFAKHTDGPALFVVMERLAHLEQDEKTLWDTAEYCSLTSVEKFRAAYFKGTAWRAKGCSKTRGEEVQDGIDAFGELLTDDFISFYIDMFAEMDVRGFNNDCHANNVMIRINPDGDRELVVTDPWFAPGTKNRCEILRSANVVYAQGTPKTRSTDLDERPLPTQWAQCNSRTGCPGSRVKCAYCPHGPHNGEEAARELKLCGWRFHLGEDKKVRFVRRLSIVPQINHLPVEHCLFDGKVCIHQGENFPCEADCRHFNFNSNPWTRVPGREGDWRKRKPLANEFVC